MSALPKLPRRPENSHKGNYGRVEIVGGSAGMIGAPALAAMAALRSGAGLVQLSCPEEIRPAVATLVPCATLNTGERLGRFNPTVRAIGPGSGDALSLRYLKDLLRDRTIPAVIDADGLNVLARAREWWSLVDEMIVLTPHPGEMRRLLDKTAIDGSLPREQQARAVSQLCRAVVVLKGHRTVIAQSEKLAVNETGNPGMATGGSGDVLTGVIAALIGQGMAPFDAARLGVHIHGIAGDMAAAQKGQVSMIATDIVEALPEAFRRYQHPGER